MKIFWKNCITKFWAIIGFSSISDLVGSVDLVHFSLKMLKYRYFSTFFIKKIFFK